ncbi:hypothetical protein GCM10023091_24130 [Ravibacter arvi]|uniref:Glycosyl transferase family 1 domain-containing protein n=1 Tax=Ravibacter arvi TaxID=2051041 RepID=A0ABP8M0L5_9BACT
MQTPSTGKKRILFLTPLASRTGSEMMLWNVINRIDKNEYEVAVASYAEGELLDHLPPGVRAYKVPGTFKTIDRINYHLGRHPIVTALKEIQKDFKADLWYLNTIVLPKAALVAEELNVPFVVHFHEMPLSYAYVNREEFELMIGKAVRLIGCSEATYAGIKQAGAENVSLCYEFIEDIAEPADQTPAKQVREELGIAEDHFVWAMSGVPSERKGFDFFPDIADLLDDERVHLMWVGGGGPQDGYISWVENRIAHSGSRTRIHLPGKQKDRYLAFLQAADGFILTSRQDPFPLVMMEVAALGKPIVSFPSGGVSELLVEGMGLVTEDISVKQLVSGMRKVMTGEVSCNPAVSKLRYRDFSIDAGMKQWNAIMAEVWAAL